MKYIVYCTTCIINGKIYIGVHKTENPDTFDGYIGCGLTCVPKHPKTQFHYAVKKYGYNKFRRSTLFIFNNKEEAYNKEAEIVNDDFVKRKDNYNTIIGGIVNIENYKPIYQYKMDGSFLKKWDSTKDAIEYFGCNGDKFNIAIKDKRSALNSYWCEDYYEKLDISKYRKSNHQEVYCYNINGELLNMFNNAKEAGEYYNITKSSINDAISHKKMIHNMYFISDIMNAENIISLNNFIYQLSDFNVSLYKDNKKVRTYTSIHQASKETKLSREYIKKQIEMRSGIWAYGFSETYPQNANIKQKVQIGQYDLNNNLIKVWDGLFECQKQFPKVRDVLRNGRKHTHGFSFKIIQ